MNIASQLAKHLEFEGFGILDKTLFWGWMPDAPDTAVCVYSSDSGIPGTERYARLQIITRAAAPKAAFELSQDIAEALDEYNGYLAGDGCKAIINIINASTGLGDDALRRSLYSTNITVLYCDGE